MFVHEWEAKVVAAAGIEAPSDFVKHSKLLSILS